MSKQTTNDIAEKIKALPDEQGGLCRDCADDEPFCQNRGMPCVLTVADLKALADELLELKAMLAEAEKVIDHYADGDSWASGRGGTRRIYRVKSVADAGFNVAREYQALREETK